MAVSRSENYLSFALKGRDEAEHVLSALRPVQQIYAVPQRAVSSCGCVELAAEPVDLNATPAVHDKGILPQRLYTHRIKV